MADKKHTKNYNVMDSRTALQDEKQENLERVKEIFPHLVNNEGKLDMEALKDDLGIENIFPAGQGYGLNFSGKGLARIKADEPTKKELKLEESQSKKPDETENVIIRGDNLDALKILWKNYYNKIKMIYIDPPYNTDNENFIYCDSFKETEAELIENYGLDEEKINFFQNRLGTRTHSGWLYFMYPRLKLARDLLSEDGAIFISIDDNEQANLKLLCDEIFGENNFITAITWQKKTGASDASTIATITEYILTYSKNNNTESLFSKNYDSYNRNRYKLEDKHKGKRGPHYIDNLDRGGLRYSDSMNFPITCPDGTITYPNGRLEFARDGWTWKWGKDKIKWAMKNDFLEFRKSKKKESGWSVCYKNYLYVDNEDIQMERAAPHKNVIILDDNINDVLNAEGNADMQELFGAKVFSNPKPCDLLKKVIQYIDTEDSIILDFFAGSGTTAQAVMELNEDGGNRKFILVQRDEKIEKEKSPTAYNFCIENTLEPVISSICIERVRRVGEKKVKSKNIDTGYKVFSLMDSPKLNQAGKRIELNIDRTTKDTLYNMIIASRKASLSDIIERIEEDKLYKIDKDYYLLGNCKVSLKDDKIDKIFVDGYADIRLEDWLNMLGLGEEKVEILY